MAADTASVEDFLKYENLFEKWWTICRMQEGSP